MGEVPALTASLLDRNDIKVTPPRNWTWTAASPWPPLQQVQACNLWHHAAYADVRARLLRPAAEFRIETGSDFVSVQMVAGGAGIAGGDVLTHGDEAMPEVCASRPPPLAGPGRPPGEGCVMTGVGKGASGRWRTCASPTQVPRWWPFVPRVLPHPPLQAEGAPHGLCNLVPLAPSVALHASIQRLRIDLVVVELSEEVRCAPTLSHPPPLPSRGGQGAGAPPWTVVGRGGAGARPLWYPPSVRRRRWGCTPSCRRC